MTEKNDQQIEGTPIGIVVAVHRNPAHSMKKETQQRIRLLTGLGVEGDAHLGKTVQHLSRISSDPSQPNLRQVHFIHTELLDELHVLGFNISAGQMGENITTRGLFLLGLPVGTRLRLGRAAIVEITGLRNPCDKLDNIQSGLMKAVIERDRENKLVGKAGIMGIVIADGDVEPNDQIQVELPQVPHRRLERV